MVFKFKTSLFTIQNVIYLTHKHVFAPMPVQGMYQLTLILSKYIIIVFNIVADPLWLCIKHIFPSTAILKIHATFKFESRYIHIVSLSLPKV